MSDSISLWLAGFYVSLLFEVGNGRVVIGTSESIRSRRKPTQ